MNAPAWDETAKIKAAREKQAMGRIVHLCDDHRTVENLRKHTEPPSERWVS